MTVQKTIDINTIEDPIEKKILVYLNKKKKSLYGEIIRELSISVNEGQKHIFSLLSRGLIKRGESSRLLELNVNID